MCSVLEITKTKNHEEKLKSFNSSHILKKGGVIAVKDDGSQYSSCSSC